MYVNINKLPLYAEVFNDLRFKIYTNEWKVDEQIPTEMELCDIYNVSRITIRKAIDLLVQEGLLYRKRAIGTFVRGMDQQESLTSIKGFTQEMTDLGKEAHTISASIQKIPASRKIANCLNIESNIPVMNLRRVLGIYESAFAFFDTYFVCNENYSLDSKDYYGSFYEYLSTFGIIVNSINEYVEAVLPDDELMKTLNITKYTPILKRVRFTKEIGKSFREYSECFYVGSEYRYYIGNVEK
ncbi:GntR family transcriptional regulator [Tissierellaceae bacterium BX21]|jgi:DNA-binding GntR family transcriptional regulator|uniref:GntR family transcriptional regulator n=1 Tax=Paratissierella segnis TaxID=2763679 RepID=A0A926ERQ4_9FIRM|nr:GntR family transcriptional regulator [Paratissierella segnis]